MGKGNHEKLHDDARRSIGPVSSLRPRTPQGATYGPVGVAKPADEGYEDYKSEHRPLVPSDEYKFDQMSKMMDEVSARHAEAAKPENIIARLNDEIAELRDKITKQQHKIYTLRRVDESKELSKKDQLKIEVREGKIAKYKLDIAEREESIAIVQEKGGLPLKPFVYKSKLRDMTKERAEDIKNTLEN